MPPKKPTVGATKTTASKPAAKGGATKSTATTKTATKTATKTTTKTAGTVSKPETKATEQEQVKVKKVFSPETIPLKEIAKVLNYDMAHDVGKKLKESKRWPYFIDRVGTVETFLKYRDTNMIQASNPTEFQPEPLRKSLQGSLCFGKPNVIIVDHDTKDQLAVLGELKAKYEEISPGLYEEILDHSINTFEKCTKLYRANDPSEYKDDYNYKVDDFMFIIVTKVDPPTSANEDFFPIIVE